MPINAAKTLEAEHAAGSACERKVIENLFIEFEQGLPIRRHFVGVQLRHIVKSSCEIASIGERRVKTIVAVCVLIDQLIVACFKQFQQPGQLFNITSRDHIFFKKIRQGAIRVEHETLLVAAIQLTVEEPIDDVGHGIHIDAAAAERSHLALQHGIKRFDVCAFGIDAHQVVGLVEAAFASIVRDTVINQCERLGEQVEDRPGLLDSCREITAVVIDFAAVAGCRLAKSSN